MSLLSFDFETHKIQPGLLAPPVVCVSQAWRESSGAIDSSLLDREQGLESIHAQLSTDVVYVGANVAYDFVCLLAARPQLMPLVWKAYEEGRVFDVLIAGTLDAIYDGRLTDDGLFNSRGKKIQSGRYSLESATEDYLGRVDAKKNDRFRTSYALLENLPIEQWPPEASQYPVDDAVNALELAEKQMRVCKNLHNLSAQAHAAFCAHLGATWGMRTDQSRVAALKMGVDANIERVQEFAKEHKLLQLGGTKKKPKWTKDTKLIKELVFQAYEGLPPKTEGGDIATSREALTESGDPILEKFAEGSKWEKLRTYADTLSELGQKPMNVECNILLATGRASYKGLIQLMPRQGGVRECCIARPDTAWVSVDFAAIEMSTLGQAQIWALGRSKLAEAINNGLDPHSYFAASMVGQDYETFVKNKKRKLESDRRQAAKAANFGFPGMMGGAKFVIAKKREGMSVCEWTYADGACGTEKAREWKGKELDGPLCVRCLEEADKLRKSYLAHWTDMRPYWSWVTSQLGHDGRLTQFVSERVRGGLSAPAAANTLFQGLASDGAKAAVIAMTKEMYLDSLSPLFGSRLIVFAHDETIIEVPKHKLTEAAARQTEIMISEMKRFVPDVRVSAEPAAMTRWYKAAEPVFVDGKLVPWEPKEIAA